MNEDSDRHSRETPRMFGPFLRRIDPMLRLEDENPVVNAFVRRRTVHSRALRMTMISWLILVTLFTALVVALINGFVILLFLIGIVVVVLSEITRVARLRSASGTRCPTCAGQLIQKNGYQRETVRDLWMCGITGSQMAEAIVLESAFLSRLGPTIIIIIGSAGTVAGAGIILHATQFWWILLPALAFVYMMVETVRHQWVTAVRSAFHDLRERLNFMRALISLQPIAARTRNALGKLMIFLGNFVLLSSVLCLLGGFLSVIGEMMSPNSAAILVCVATAAASTLVGFWLRLRRRRFWIRNYREFRKICLGYDFVFDRFVRVVILEDHEA